MTARVFPVASAATLAAAVSAAQAPGPRAFVLDQGARTLTALAVPSGRVEQTATLQGTPSRLLRTADGQRLLVLDRGEGRDAGDDGVERDFPCEHFAWPWY